MPKELIADSGSESEMKRGLVLVAACLLTACQGAPVGSSDWSDKAGPRPSNYRELIREQVRLTFKDPYSIRDARVSQPQPGSNVLIGEGWFVCLQANAKNSFGAYVGLKYVLFRIQYGRVTMTTGDAAAEVNCPDIGNWSDLYDKDHPSPAS